MEIYDKGLRLRALREKRRLTRQAAADRLGVTRATVSAYETNTRTPSVDMLIKLAVLYHSSVDYILGLENRANNFIDLQDSQQETVIKLIELLRAEFLNC